MVICIYKLMKNIIYFLYIILISFTIFSGICYAVNTPWVAIKDSDLRIVSGSALDFSKLINDSPITGGAIGINNQGELAYNNGKGKKVRFLCAPLVLTKPYGGFPDHKTADELARQIKMHGYNLVRLHHIDSTLMEGMEHDFQFNPEQLDRFYYLLAALKKQGLYWMIDAASSWNGAYGNIKPHRFAKVHNLNLTVHYDAKSQQHWKKLVNKILNVKNKYTQINILQDPNLILLTLFNEGGINFSARRGYPKELKPLFINWQKQQGLKDIVDSLPKRREKSSDAALMQRFITELEIKTAQWMSEYIRGLGYKGLITAYNNGKNAQVNAPKSQLDVISVHGYFDHPSKFIRKGSKQKGISSISRNLSYIGYFSTSRYLGKPFILDEYDHPYWSQYRREAGIAVSAYAAMQDWDGICRFANPVALEYNNKAAKRMRSLFPFGIGLDPVARAGETLAYFLFRRGDVKASEKTVTLELNDDYLYSSKSSVKGISKQDKMLSLLARIGLKRQADKTQSDLSLPAEIDNKSSVSSLFGSSGSQALTDALIQKLEASGIKNKGDDFTNGIKSSTGQIIIYSDKNEMTVISPRTEAVASEFKQPVHLSAMSVNSNTPATISVSSLDNQPVEASRHLLIIAATDARNTGDIYSEDRTLLVKHGFLPVLIKSIKFNIELKNTSQSSFKLYALSLTGKRTELIPVEYNNGLLKFSVDTSLLDKGATTYFELLSAGM